jgi:hypothetical protein
MAKIRGAKELRAAIKRAGPALRKEATAEVRASTKRMHGTVMMLLGTAAMYAPLYHGGAGMQNITGTARRSYRFSVSEARMSGRVGLLSAAAESRAFHLRFFFYGTVHQPARNAHDDAFERERDVFIDNQTKALQRVVSQI